MLPPMSETGDHPEEPNSKMINMTLYGGPMDGEVIEFHPDNLKYKPILNCENEQGVQASYALDEKGNFTWCATDDDPRLQGSGFICDDDGNILAEVSDPEEGMALLDLLEKAESLGTEEDEEGKEEEEKP
jgi:hypothetical protein